MKTLKLNSLDYARLHNAEFGQLVIRFFEDFEQSGLSLDTDADFKKVYGRLRAAIPTYNKAIAQTRARAESKKLQQLDACRDASLQSLRDAIKPYRKSKIAEEQEAYTALKILLTHYKGVEKNSYEEETHQLNSLVAALESEHYAGKASVLAVTKFVANLKADNVAFNDVFAHRSLAVSQKESYDVKALRKALLTDYKKMANYILALADVKEDEFYKSVLEIINNGRKYFADIIARRTAKKAQPADENPL